ncbi:MAG: transposase, partial [Patescibacteria group bacterium]
MKIARRIALRPSRAQRKALARHSGASRWAYNWGLRRKQEEHAAGRKTPTAIDLHKEVVGLKHRPAEDGGAPWLCEVSKCAPQEALRDLDVAYGRFFAKRGRHPKFHAKRPGEGGFRLTGSIRIEDGCVTLPRLGRLRIQPGCRGYASSGIYGSARLVQEHGEWFCSVLEAVPCEPPSVAPDALAEVGLDLGARKLAVLASPDGGIEIFPNRRALLRATRKLRAAQRVVARRKKGSGRRRRAVRCLGRVHRRVARVRRDMTHKATAKIAARYKVVAMEDLRVGNMTRRAHGKGRRAKSGLNRVVLDANLGEFRRQLTYKLALRGGRIVFVSPAYSSQRCSHCGDYNDPGSSE